MFLVAIVRLAGTIGHEAAALAADFGTVAYDERMKLASGMPTVVLATADPARADAALVALRARGHTALVCRPSDVTAAEDMVSLRRFQLNDQALATPDAQLAWSEISVLVRATQRMRSETTAVVKEKKFDLTRAIATGGLVNRKTTTRNVTTRSEDSEQLLYVFRRDRGTPWLLRERGTSFAALGDRTMSTSVHNFPLAVDAIRLRTPQATFDDRLVSRKCAPEDLDLLAHLTAAGSG